MKKMKSLLSLMLVMILMLSVAGPMAFADANGTQANPYTVTVTANNPKYSPSQGKYIQDGVTVVNDQTGTTLTVVPANLQECTVSEDNTSATAFPNAGLAKGSTFVGSNGVYYKVATANNSTLVKPVLKVSPEIVYFDTVNKQYTGATAKLEGLVGSDTVFCEFSTVTTGNSVSITPVNVQVKNGDINVASRYFVSTEAKTFDKPSFSITLATPVYNAGTGKYDVSGAADSTVTTIKLSTGDFSVSPIFDVNNVSVSTVNGVATASLSPSYVTLNANGANVTAAFNVSVNGSSLAKRVIHIYANSPVNGKTNGFYALNADGSHVTDYDVYANVYMDGSVAKIDASSVEIYLAGTTSPLFNNSFDIKYHYASNDGDNDGNNDNDNSNNTSTTKTNLVITAVDAEKAYNGYSFSATQARGVKVTGLLSGHKLNADVLKMQYTRRSDNTIFTEYTSVVKVGTYDKTLIVPQSNVVLDANGNDVTSQYNISTVDGILTIYNSGWTSPDTGDHSNIGLWIVLLAASAAAVGAVVFVVLKKGKKA